MSSDDPITIKLVAVGDGGIGKTCLLITFASNTFPEDYVPKVFDYYVVNVTAGDKQIELGLCDTDFGYNSEDREYNIRRCIANASVLLICFSVTNPASFQNVQEEWLPEVSRTCPDVPLILVGTKLDTRTDEGVLSRLRAQQQEPVNPKEGQALARKFNAFKYIECSAKTSENMKMVFDEAIKAVLSRKKKGHCTLL